LNLGTGAVTNSGSRTITLNGAGALTFGGVMTNTAGAINTMTVNDGTGTTSTTAVSFGGYALSNSATSYVDIINGTGNVNITGAVINGGTATTSGLTYSGSGLLTLSGNNSYGGLTTVSSGALTLSGNNSGAGGVTVSGGTLNVNNANALGAVGGRLTLSAGAIDNTSGGAITNAIANPITLGGNFAYSTASGTINNNLNLGTGAVTNSGSRTITLNGAGALTFGGVMTNTAGAINTMTVNDGTGTTSTTAVSFGGYALSNNATSYVDVINGTGNVNITGAVTNGGTATTSGLTYSGSGLLTLSGNNSYGGLTTVSSGALTLSGNNSGAGGVTVSGGTLNVNNANALGAVGGRLTLSAGAIDNTSGGAITNAIANPITLGGNFAYSTASGTINNNLNLGTGAVTNSGSRTITLNGAGALTFGGVMTNTAGAINTMTVNDGTGTTSTTAVSFGGYALSNSAISYIDIINGSGNVNITGAVTNGGTATASGLTYSGSGLLTLSGVSTYAGATTVQAGSLVAGTDSLASANGAFGNASSAVVLGNGSTAAGDAPSLLINGAFTVGRAITVGSVADAAAYNATIGGSNTIGTSTYTGNITLNTTATGYTATLQAATGGTVEFKTGTWTTNNKAIAIGSSSNTGTVKLSNNLVTTGGVNVKYGTLLLGAANALGGSTTPVTVSGGTLDVSGFADTVSSLNITSGALNLGIANNTPVLLTISNAFTLGGTINVASTGTQTLGLYKLAGYGSKSGSFTQGIVPANYKLVANTTELDLQHLAGQTLTGANPAVINIITGATTSVSAILTNTSPSGSFSLGVSLADNGSTGGSLGAFTGTGPVAANNGTLTVGATLTAGAVGTGQTWSMKNTDANAVIPSVNTGGIVNVYNHSAPTLTVASGNNQSIITGGSFASATLTLSDTVGSTPAPLDVNTLSNLIGNTGSGVVGSGSTEIYSVTGFNTITVGLGKSLSTSLHAGDQQTITGAGAMGSLSQNLTYNVYDHASGLASGTLALGNIHQGYASPVTSSSVSATNASGTRANLMGSATPNGNISLSNLSGIVSGSNGNITATLAVGQSAGLINQAFTYTFADDSMLSGASSNVGTASLTVTGLVYSGQGVWNTAGGGNWNDFSKWTTNGGSPGLAAAFVNTDAATFGLAAGSGTVSVDLNGASPSLAGLVFDNAAASYVIAQGSGSSPLKLNNGGSKATITVSNGSHTISAPVEMDSDGSVTVVNVADILTVSGSVSESGGAKNLTKDGSGTLTMSGVSSYTGTTSVQGGTLVVSGSLRGTTAVNVSSGAALYLSGSINVASTLTVSGTLSAQGALGVIVAASGGRILMGSQPGSATTGRLSATGLTIQSGAQLSMRIGGTTAGTDYDQMSVSGGVSLAGDLTGSLLNGYTPTEATFTGGHLNLDGSTFYLVIGASGLSGTFANQTSGNVYTGNYATVTIGGQLFAISYEANWALGEFDTSVQGGAGHDIALMAIPEPSVLGSILIGSAFLLGLRGKRLRRL
ncbi:MAG: autotransporter-associated beta strand repeat-containing protein, partial [Verrucomicrobiota bacterium]